MSVATLPGLSGARPLADERAVARTPLRSRLGAWLVAVRLDLALLVPVLGVTGVVHAIGMSAWPPLDNDDEGTYMAESWAVLTGRGPHHGLAQYTYWYDHPPLGWIQLAGLTWLTRAYRAGTVAVVSGRGLMLVYALVSSVLVYVLARRLGCRRGWSAVATAMFGLSPLAVEYLRLVFLDCIGLPWVLAAFVLAISPKRRIRTHAMSGACFAIAVLSKETFLIVAPAIWWQAWQGCDRRTRRMAMTAFGITSAAVLSFYPIYAALKGELFPGKGHVSLLGSAFWQLDQRAGSGSVFSGSSGSHAQVMSWLHSDPWMIGLALAVLPVAFLDFRLRPAAATYAIFGAMLLRKGYLPNAFVVGALPFAAILIGAVGDRVGAALQLTWHHAREVHGPMRLVQLAAVGLAGTAFAGVLVLGASRAVPAWASEDHARMTTDAVNLAPIEQAEAWVDHHVAKRSTLLVDDDVWTDFVDNGFEPDNVVWVYKLDLDPAVAHRFPGGWRDMDYVILTPALRGDLGGDPAGTADPEKAIAHSHAIASFGSGAEKVTVLKVAHPRAEETRRRTEPMTTNPPPPV